MAGIRGKSGPPGNQNAFRHGLAGISQRQTLQDIFDEMGDNAAQDQSS